MKPKPVVITRSFRSASVKAILLLLTFTGYSAIAQQAVKKSTAPKKKAVASASKSLIPKEHTEWRDFGGGPDHSKFVDFTQINKQNVTQLQPALIYSTANDKTGYRFNPIIVDNVMYVIAKNGSLVAVNATTGKEIWIHTNMRIGQRGINFWQSPDKKQKRLIVTIGQTLQEIDAITGLSILSFGNNGSVDLKQGLDRDPSLFRVAASTSPGHVYKNLIIVGSSPGENLFSGPGHVRAFNILTGKQEWIFHTIPMPGEPGYETWGNKDSYKYVGAINTWGEISVDEKNGIAFFPLGSPTYDYDGADRVGKGLYGNCLLALDARTGKHLWHFQLVHHDMWDYDVTAAPQLITVMHKGKKVEAVAVAGKGGYLFAFNRLTGAPLWPIEERPVPKSDMPDENAWPTQPFQPQLPPFDRHQVTVDDMNPYLSPAKKEALTKRLLAAKSAPFQPLSDKYEVLSNPGSVGGANYGNTAANPDKGLVYVMFQEVSDFYLLKKRSDQPQGRGQGGAFAGNAKGQIAYAQYCQTCHGADRAGTAENGGAPTLLTLAGRVDQTNFKSVLSSGRGRMPSFPHLEDSTVNAIYAYLVPPAGGRGGRGGRGGAGAAEPVIDGPVVASGGAPMPAGAAGGGFGGGGMKDYPEGYTGKKVQFVEAHNWGDNPGNILSPPWCGIAAYDLNKGIMKWRIGLGDDAQSGTKGMGLNNGTQNHGMVITKSGLVFATCKDGKLRAIDADNGKVIWEYDLGRDANGIPAIYKENGREYLVVCATGGLTDKTKAEADVPKGYIAFALPEKK